MRAAVAVDVAVRELYRSITALQGLDGPEAPGEVRMVLAHLESAAEGLPRVLDELAGAVRVAVADGAVVRDRGDGEAFPFPEEAAVLGARVQLDLAADGAEAMAEGLAAARRLVDGLEVPPV